MGDFDIAMFEYQGMSWLSCWIIIIYKIQNMYILDILCIYIYIMYVLYIYIVCVCDDILDVRNMFL